MKAFGHIDILINNGGISFRGDINNTNIDVDMKVMLVNYFGQVAVTKGENLGFFLRTFKKYVAI